MATIYDIIEGLEEEMTRAIISITPNGPQDPPFESPIELEEEDILQSSGKTRLFQVAFMPPKRLSVGCSTAVFELNGTITIGYPVEHKWTRAMHSDASQIYNKFNKGDTAVDGVNYRELPNEEEPTIENVDDDWRWLVIPITARVTAEE